MLSRHCAMPPVAGGSGQALSVPLFLFFWGGGDLLGSIAYLFLTSKSQLAPQEDQGVVMYQLIGPPDATLQQVRSYERQIYQAARTLPEYRQMFQITGTPSVNQGLGGVLLKPWNRRIRTATQIQKILQARWNHIAGARIGAFQFPPLPGASGLPVQFEITTAQPISRLYSVARQVLARARASGRFFFVDSDLKIDEPQDELMVSPSKVADLGLTQQDVASTLGAALGGGYVNYFELGGRSYEVIPQVQQRYRLNPHQILDYHLRTASGALVEFGTVARLKRAVVPQAINRLQRLNSAMIAGVAAVPQGQALAFLRKTLHEVAPSGFRANYAGESRQFMKGSNSFLMTFGFSLVIVFLALAALFGALLFINIGFTTLNIYAQVGLVTLLGLISKHGILMVQFANDLQRAGVSKLRAIEEAAEVRLRPILMTTAAMVVGVLPMVFATGAGAARPPEN